MRWPKNQPSIGEIRFKRKFLYFPKYLNNEYRWLEYAVIIESFTKGCFSAAYYWEETDWGNT